MFRWINKQGIASDKGFIVQRIGRFELEYRENSKYISIYVEPGYTEGGKRALIIDSTSFTTWSDGQPVTLIKQNEILENLKEALVFKKLEFIID